MSWINMHWIKKWFVIFGLMTVITLVSIKIFDVLVGIFGDVELSQLERSVKLREHRPLQRVFYKPLSSEAENLEDKKYVLRTDRDGYILGAGEQATSTVKNIDILFLGGSTTETSLVDEDKRFPFLISKFIKKSDGSRVTTLNGGVSGNHSLHSLINFIAKGIPHKPKYVVLMHAINDVGTLIHTYSYWDAPATRSIIQTNTIGPSMYDWMKWFENAFIPYTWLHIRHYARPMVGKITDEWASHRNRKTDKEQVLRVLQSHFYPSLKSFVSVSRAFGIEPILMTQFNRIKLDDDLYMDGYSRREMPLTAQEFYDVYHAANQMVRDVAKEKNVVLIDLASKIETTSEYMYDTMHLNNAGSERVAELLAKKFIKFFPSEFVLSR